MSKNFRLVCHSCGHKFPRDVPLFELRDCCAKCDLHVHDIDHPCAHCNGDDIGEVPVYGFTLELPPGVKCADLKVTEGEGISAVNVRAARKLGILDDD